MTTLVTGGAGYIGSHTVRALRASGREVVVIDTLELGYRSAVIDAVLVEGDVADRVLVSKVCRDYDVTEIVHFAAYKSVAESMVHPGKYWQNNVGGTVALVEALRDCDVHRLVFSSSCSVYGTPDRVPVSETAPLHPESVYAESKTTMERILRWYDTTHAVRSISLRYFNAAGASHDNVIGEDWDHSINLIPVVMKATLGLRGPVQVFGDDYPTPDGTAIRDYIHVEDLADAHVRALDHLVEGGMTQAINIGTGTGSSVMEVIRATERTSGRTVPHDVVRRRLGDPVAVFADASRAATVLGWHPRHGLDDIIATAWRWHSTHLDGLGS